MYEKSVVYRYFQQSVKSFGECCTTLIHFEHHKLVRWILSCHFISSLFADSLFIFIYWFVMHRRNPLIYDIFNKFKLYKCNIYTNNPPKVRANGNPLLRKFGKPIELKDFGFSVHTYAKRTATRWTPCATHILGGK